MAFVSTVVNKASMGDMRFHSGTWEVNGTTQGGNIDTGLKTVYGMWCVITSTSGSTKDVYVDVTSYPTDGTAVAIVADEIMVGEWYAFGK